MRSTAVDMQHRASVTVQRLPKELVNRVWSEFQEMPGLCLTLRQAQRLFGVDADLCGQVLDALVEVRQLSIRAGCYLKNGSETAATVAHALVTRPASARGPEHVPAGPIRPLRQILVVDDDSDIVRALTMRLKSAGFDVIAAHDGESALALAARHRPHAIILDLGLPGCDGHVVTKRLRSDPATAEIPVIVLTARATRMDFRKAHAAGAAGYFVKPYRADELLRKVGQVVGDAA